MKMNKSFFVVGGILLSFLVLFVYLLSTGSSLDDARTELKTCTTIEAVKQAYQQHTDLHKNERYDIATRDHLAAFKLTDAQLQAILQWLPPLRQNSNIIVVPDLSKRLQGEYQGFQAVKTAETDLRLLDEIWDAFKTATEQQENTKDRLIIDVADENQAQGKFALIADSLVFDLATHIPDKSNGYFFKQNKVRFQKYIQALYQQAQEKPLGCDYWHYFNRNLARQLKKNTLYDSYQNKLILITDGYLETEQHLYTGTEADRQAICNAAKKGIAMPDAFAQQKQNIASCGDFSNLEVLILEIDERKNGIDCDYDVLKLYWQNWLTAMHVKNAADPNAFLQRSDAATTTLNLVKNFIKNTPL